MMTAAIYSGVPAPVFVAGIKYPSFFRAQFETGISQTSFSLALKKSGGEPCEIKRNFVVLETWVYARLKSVKREYAI
jgi:hypothetical protein